MAILNALGKSSTEEKSHDSGVGVVRPSGWNGVANVLRDIDKEKINDCKEDIDTLLVFAGLFSAVMTAFIIESYQLLSEDLVQVAVLALKDIRAELRIIRAGGSFVNSTNPENPASDISFEPSAAAIQVNVLWFASLVLSLATASFGILVKQWLREYLAIDSVSPQARVRVRHFRQPGLGTWKVFEIAAALPVLLQISLGLFFLGLCIFTWSIHHSVGYASTTLVLGWLVFFFLTTIAPLVSSRCPYKTTFLKRALEYIRSRLRGVVHSCYHKVTKSPEPPAPKFTEAEAMATQENDADILLAVDGALTDDELLRTMIWDSFLQLRHGASQTITFLSRIIENRTGIAQGMYGSGTPLDLRRLSKQTMEVITELIVGMLKHYEDTSATQETPRPLDTDQSWIISAVRIICARSRYELPVKYMMAVYQLLPRLKEDLRASVMETMASRCLWMGEGVNTIALDDHTVFVNNHSGLHKHFARLAGLKYTPSEPYMLSCTAMICTQPVNSETIGPLSKLLVSCEADKDAWETVLRPMLDRLKAVLLGDQKADDTRADSIQCLCSVFFHSLSNARTNADGLRDLGLNDLLISLFRNSNHAGVVWTAISDNLIQYGRVHNQNLWSNIAFRVGSGIYFNSKYTSKVLSDILRNISLLLTQPSGLDALSLDYTYICYFIAHFAYATMQQGDKTYPVNPHWLPLSVALAARPQTQLRMVSGYSDMWAAILTLVEIDIISRRTNVQRAYEEPDEDSYSAWVKDFDPDKAAFCDNLVRVLISKCNMSGDLKGIAILRESWKQKQVKDLFRVRRILVIDARSPAGC